MFEQKIEDHNKNEKMALKKKNLGEKKKTKCTIIFQVGSCTEYYWSFNHNLMAKKNILKIVYFLQ